MSRSPLQLAVVGMGLLALTALAGRSPVPTSLVAPLATAVLTQPFGCTSVVLERADPACPGGHFHSGLDLAAPAGTPVWAAAPGVAKVGSDSAGYGLYVLLTYGRLATLYAHLGGVAVQNGQPVTRGEVIGRVGSSGLATGPHLHFEVREAGVAVDPLPLLPQGFIVREG